MRAWASFVVALVALASATEAATYTWTGGGGANTNWSNASNWGGSAPANDESGVELVFPALAGHYASSNDRTGLRVASLGVTTQLSDGDYEFTGNAITLDGPVTMANPSSGNPNLVWQIAMALGGDVTIATSGRQTQVQANVDLGASTLTFDAEGDVVLAGVVSGSGNLVKDNSSALSISGANTYTGSTTSNRGALYIANAMALGGATTGTTINRGFLGFVPGSMFSLAEPVTFTGGGILAYGTPTMTGPLTLNAMIEIEPFETLSVLTISGTLAGPGGFDMTGPGLLILNAPAELYEGATGVGDGTLRLDADLSSTNPLTVGGGATLQGNASSEGPIVVQDGGTLAPGTSPGELTSTGLTMVAGAMLAVDIDGPNPVTQHDRIAVDGPVSLGGATLVVTLGYAPPDGQQFTLISQLQGQPVSGTFAGLAEGATFQVGNATFGITYQGGSGNDVVLRAGGPPDTPTITATVPVSSTPTQTATFPSATATSAVATATPTMTPAVSFTATLGTPTATMMVPACTGDCDGTDSVSISELVLGVNIALGLAPLSECPAFDPDGTGEVSIAELIQAVGNALTGCPESAGAAPSAP